ncbi:RteC domain-containing protein [Kaistella sp. G5-32]|uniref:RteC domain-containing protein n=1 Tax=Kaistella gelatinilytica TaxID=2787636 RepID=A0ABS0FC03_9FLAO|nr:RteC domain-containing protein [Kaistella gelatinilytica]MBF8457243.1 RteC domain-containing protein [Kaistella gelatinilytica]
MNSLQLIAKTSKLWSDLENKINELKTEKKHPLEEAQFALIATDEAIRTVKGWVIIHDFDCWENEITFFKKLKPKLIGSFIYYSKLVSFLSALPSSGDKLKRKVFENEFDHLQYFSLENKDFISYCRRNATYLDSKYFLRFKYDLDVKLSIDIHSYDDRFSSSHDHLVSQMIANDSYEKFLRAELSKLKNSHTDEERSHSNIQWSASKVALTELVVALHQTRCLNGGNKDLSETIKWFENNFEIDLGNYHKTLIEIRSRKNDKAKFLHLLTENLTNYLESFDE